MLIQVHALLVHTHKHTIRFTSKFFILISFLCVFFFFSKMHKCIHNVRHFGFCYERVSVQYVRFGLTNEVRQNGNRRRETICRSFVSFIFIFSSLEKKLLRRANIYSISMISLASHFFLTFPFRNSVMHSHVTTSTTSPTATERRRHSPDHITHFTMWQKSSGGATMPSGKRSQENCVKTETVHAPTQHVSMYLMSSERLRINNISESIIRAAVTVYSTRFILCPFSVCLRLPSAHRSAAAGCSQAHTHDIS